ncbi:hypothetical protein LZF95_00410 [Algoriphagus sp. AGSA1]|uniref:hypothetical protein n=1 Tax=Algoriphagus sp. AGSA1 TaxID=2907213 RepID=UPI001F337295|nr:hypothetical protein [Algoriphagus sp. AGSA1]MCE7053116.1 hypothetical protein [Algoriphagus sp. AGSA1]
MRELKKTVLAIVFFSIFSGKVLVAQSIPANQLVLPSKTFVLPFFWQGDTIGSKWEANAAMLIPVNLKDCPRRFYMQFDLGAPYSLLYGNKLEAIESEFPGSFPQEVMDGKLANFSFKAEQVPILAKEIEVKKFDDSAIDWQNEDGVEIIGTIGADLIDDRIAIIDYPDKKLTISQAIPEKIGEDMSLSDFIYSHRRVLLPAKVNGKETLLYFDTGSSMFELLTDKETSERLAAPDASPIQFTVKSWDRFLTANSLASNSIIEIAGVSIPVTSSTYIEGISDSQIEQMSKMGIGGMTGNKLFLNYRLVLDTKNHKFGLIPSF